MDGSVLPTFAKRLAAAPLIAIGLFAVTAPAGSALADDRLIQPNLADPDVAERFAALPDPKLRLEPALGAVDVTEIDIPIEEESETTARSIGAGMASYYGRRFHGRRTANGERFDMHAMTAAHKTLPFGTLVEVTNPNNGRSVTVRINDRGPFIRGRTIDLSRAAASEIGIIQRGHGKVALALVE
ncbi:MAG: septal ring lytic transglycosylase RlpA family protein [Alteripontixanthobacter sp.]